MLELGFTSRSLINAYSFFVLWNSYDIERTVNLPQWVSSWSGYSAWIRLRIRLHWVVEVVIEFYAAYFLFHSLRLIFFCFEIFMILCWPYLFLLLQVLLYGVWNWLPFLAILLVEENWHMRSSCFSWRLMMHLVYWFNKVRVLVCWYTFSMLSKKTMQMNWLRDWVKVSSI